MGHVYLKNLTNLTKEHLNQKACSIKELIDFCLSKIKEQAEEVEEYEETYNNGIQIQDDARDLFYKMFHDDYEKDETEESVLAKIKELKVKYAENKVKENKLDENNNKYTLHCAEGCYDDEGMLTMGFNLLFYGLVKSKSVEPVATTDDEKKRLLKVWNNDDENSNESLNIVWQLTEKGKKEFPDIDYVCL